MEKYDLPANPSIVGRFLSWEMLERMQAWPYASDDFCLADLVGHAIPRDFHMVSHAWLAPWHPDPEKQKFTSLLECLRATRAFAAILADLEPTRINRAMQEELLHAMRHTARLGDTAGAWMDQMPCNQWGYDPVRSGAKFHAWATEAMQRSLRSPLWLDSYALPNPEHRRKCSFCSQRLNGVLFRIPQLIRQGTCLILPNSAPAHLKRGWVMLEQISAVLGRRVAMVMDQDSAVSWREGILEAKARFVQADYKCGTIFDGARLPLLYAIERVRVTSRQSIPYGYTPPPNAERDLLRWVTDNLTRYEVERYPLTVRLESVIWMVIKPAFISRCRSIAVLPDTTGGLLLLTLTHMATACLVSYCWLTSTQFHHEATETLVQACLYKFIWQDDDISYAAMLTVTALEIILNIKLLKESITPRGIANQRDVDEIMKLYAHWHGGGKTNVSPDIGNSLRHGSYREPPAEEDIPVLDDVNDAMFHPVDPCPEADIEALRPKELTRRIHSDEGPENLFQRGGLPTIAEMKTLPIWGCVAFASHCFRRVRPFLLGYWPDIPFKYLETMDALVGLCEQACQEPDFIVPIGKVRDLRNSLKLVHNEANQLREKAFKAGQEPDVESLDLASRCQFIISTAICCGHTQIEAARSNYHETANNASLAAKYAAMGVKANDQIVADVRADLDAIVAACRKHEWRHFNLAPLLYFVQKGAPHFVDYNNL